MALRLLLLITLFCSGCAVASKEAAAPVPEKQEVANAPASAGPGATVAEVARAAQPAAEVTPTSWETDSLERDDLRAASRVHVKLPYADVTLATGVSARKGHFKLTKVAGPAQCKARVTITPELIEVAELAHPPALSGVAKNKSGIPSATPCRFAIELGLHEAVETAVELTRGSLTAESWEKSLKVKLDWGDVDVGQVADLNVVCGRCNLAGEGVSGALQYQIESGNVGLEGLEGAVEGSTHGDTVLKWRKLRSGSEVKVASKAGDVILVFPSSVPLKMDVKAPRGDLVSQLTDHENGVPVSIVAEIGNVHVYRSGKDR